METIVFRGELLASGRVKGGVLQVELEKCSERWNEVFLKASLLMFKVIFFVQTLYKYKLQIKLERYDPCARMTRTNREVYQVYIYRTVCILPQKYMGVSMIFLVCTPKDECFFLTTSYRYSLSVFIFKVSNLWSIWGTTILDNGRNILKS